MTVSKKSIININTPPPYLSLAREERLPTVLTVAGSDSSGGAGIEADLKTFTAHRCYGMTCASALTIQTPAKVHDIFKIPQSIISQILDANLKDMRCDVIKCGMLTEEAVEALSTKLNQLGAARPKLVVDPVLVATSGSSLASEGVAKLLIEKITHFADILTPNIPEAFKLLNKQEVSIKSSDELLDLAKNVSIVTKCKNVLVKGGHLGAEAIKDNKITDVLYMSEEDKYIVYKGNFVETKNTHGTGCTLSSAIASNIARGYSLPQAVYGAIEYVQNGIIIGCNVTQKHITSNGPINHVYAVEIPLEKMVSDDCFDAHSLVPKPKFTNHPEIKASFFEYLIKHPYVKPHWESYINHDFVKQVAQGTLEPKKFQFFIEQDYTYLVDYARVHCIAASKSPSLEDIEKELVIVGSIKHEITAHENKLRTFFGVKDDSYFANIKRGPALNNYSRYFNDVAKRGNWQELVASLIPCLMGYGKALIVHKDYITKNEKYPYYFDWCTVYSANDYTNAMNEGIELLDEIALTYPSEQLDTLVKIFGDVCELETKFWDAALEYEG